MPVNIDPDTEQARLRRLAAYRLRIREAAKRREALRLYRLKLGAVRYDHHHNIFLGND